MSASCQSQHRRAPEALQSPIQLLSAPDGTLRLPLLIHPHSQGGAGYAKTASIADGPMRAPVSAHPALPAFRCATAATDDAMSSAAVPPPPQRPPSTKPSAAPSRRRRGWEAPRRRRPCSPLQHHGALRHRNHRQEAAALLQPCYSPWRHPQAPGANLHSASSGAAANGSSSRSCGSSCSRGSGPRAAAPARCEGVAVAGLLHPRSCPQRWQ